MEEDHVNGQLRLVVRQSVDGHIVGPVYGRLWSFRGEGPGLAVFIVLSCQLSVSLHALDLECLVL